MNNLSHNRSEDSLVIFMHVPKTAGTSLRHIVQYQFQPKNVFEFYNLKTLPPKVLKGLEKYNNLSEAQKKAIKFVSGHVGFGLHEYLSRPCTYITILRDPVERVISYYYFLCRNQNSIVANKTLAEFAQTFGGVHNSMTCYLSGLTLKVQLEGFSSDLKSQQFDRETLKKAKINLDNYFKVFGFVDKFDETCVLLRRILGWNTSSFSLRKNTAKQSNSIREIPMETLNLIQKFNELDISLYNYAQEKFAAMIEQQGADFQAELDNFRFVQQSGNKKIYFQLNSSYKRMAYTVYEKLH